MTTAPKVYVGCAGWAIPKPVQSQFPGEGTNLERYALQFPAVEINSSFYRPHKPATYARWRDSVPDEFRFSVKIPKTITHGLKLVDPGALLEAFLAQAGQLAAKLGCLLVQLPPKLAFNEATASSFFAELRRQYQGPVALEPRHATWFAEDATALIASHTIARVAADPAVVPEAKGPGGDGSMAYYRLHGSPRIYFSEYSPDALQQLGVQVEPLLKGGTSVWCIFDNTTLGAATPNALTLLELLGGSSGATRPGHKRRR